MQPDRRGFLQTLSRAISGLYLGTSGAWARGLGIVSFLSAGIALFWRRQPALHLDSGYVPVWHPRCSGLHTDHSLTLRKEIAPGRIKELVLTGAPARLWCLCAGGYSEIALVNVLMRERGFDAALALKHVVTFLDSMYRHDFLTRETARGVVAQTSTEVEGTLTRGEQAWQQLICFSHNGTKPVRL